jgi:hypothetical protein
MTVLLGAQLIEVTKQKISNKQKSSFKIELTR